MSSVADLDRPSSPSQERQLSPVDSPVTSYVRKPDALPASPPSSLEEVRAAVAHIASSQAVDKDTALEITRLFHATEVLLLHECRTRDAALADAHSLLERQRMESELDRLARREHAANAVAVSRRGR
jgi:hypothetical protein